MHLPLGNPDVAFEAYQSRAWENSLTDTENEQRRKLAYSSAKENLLKNRIPLPRNEARNMFGVADETCTPEYGQVFIRYKNFDSENGDTYTVVTGNALVTKMPCLYPGDFRKLIDVDVSQLKTCVRDCIVFPMEGPRPHLDKMS